MVIHQVLLDNTAVKNFRLFVQRNASNLNVVSKILYPTPCTLPDIWMRRHFCKTAPESNKIKAVSKTTIIRSFRNKKLTGSASFRRCNIKTTHINFINEELGIQIQKTLQSNPPKAIEIVRRVVSKTNQQNEEDLELRFVTENGSESVKFNDDHTYSTPDNEKTNLSDEALGSISNEYQQNASLDQHEINLNNANNFEPKIIPVVDQESSNFDQQLIKKDSVTEENYQHDIEPELIPEDGQQSNFDQLAIKMNSVGEGNELNVENPELLPLQQQDQLEVMRSSVLEGNELNAVEPRLISEEVQENPHFDQLQIKNNYVAEINQGNTVVKSRVEELLQDQQNSNYNETQTKMSYVAEENDLKAAEKALNREEVLQEPNLDQLKITNSSVQEENEQYAAAPELIPAEGQQNTNADQIEITNSSVQEENEQYAAAPELTPAEGQQHINADQIEITNSSVQEGNEQYAAAPELIPAEGQQNTNADQLEITNSSVQDGNEQYAAAPELTPAEGQQHINADQIEITNSSVQDGNEQYAAVPELTPAEGQQHINADQIEITNSSVQDGNEQYAAAPELTPAEGQQHINADQIEITNSSVQEGNEQYAAAPELTPAEGQQHINADQIEITNSSVQEGNEQYAAAPELTPAEGQQNPNADQIEITNSSVQEGNEQYAAAPELTPVEGQQHINADQIEITNSSVQEGNEQYAAAAELIPAEGQQNTNADEIEITNSSVQEENEQYAAAPELTPAEGQQNTNADQLEITNSSVQEATEIYPAEPELTPGMSTLNALESIYISADLLQKYIADGHEVTNRSVVEGIEVNARNTVLTPEEQQNSYSGQPEITKGSDSETSKLNDLEPVFISRGVVQKANSEQPERTNSSDLNTLEDQHDIGNKLAAEKQCLNSELISKEDQENVEYDRLEIVNCFVTDEKEQQNAQLDQFEVRDNFAVEEKPLYGLQQEFNQQETQESVDFGKIAVNNNFLAEQNEQNNLKADTEYDNDQRKTKLKTNNNNIATGNDYLSPEIRFELKQRLSCLLRTQSIENDKITIAGGGQMSSAISALLLQKRLTNELVIMDTQETETKTDALEFLHASPLVGSPKITTCLSTFEETKGSKFVIITAEAEPEFGMNHMEMSQKTVNILKNIVPSLAKASPMATFIVLSKPANLMTWATQKIGQLGRDRCFNTGCHLETARFKYYLADCLDIVPNAINGFVIGNHGDDCLPVWSSVVAAGLRLSSIFPNIGNPEDTLNWNEIRKKGNSAKRQPHTEWATAMATVDIVESLKDSCGRVLCLGTNISGFNGINEDVVLSLPCVLTKDGINEILELPLTTWETDQLHQTAEKLYESQQNLKLIME